MREKREEREKELAWGTTYDRGILSAGTVSLYIYAADKRYTPNSMSRLGKQNAGETRTILRSPITNITNIDANVHGGIAWTRIGLATAKSGAVSDNWVEQFFQLNLWKTY
jgi:hypothetical protein